MFKTVLLKIANWWQFECRDGYTPDLISKLAWDVKTRSIHEEELSKISIGSLIICSKPNCDVTFSIINYGGKWIAKEDAYMRSAKNFLPWNFLVTIKVGIVECWPEIWGSFEVVKDCHIISLLCYQIV